MSLPFARRLAHLARDERPGQSPGRWHGGGGQALLSAHAYNVERTLAVLDAWAAEYADDSAVAG